MCLMEMDYESTHKALSSWKAIVSGFSQDAYSPVVCKTWHFLTFGVCCNGSLSQATMLAGFVSKFCVEPRRTLPNISHQDINII